MLHGILDNGDRHPDNNLMQMEPNKSNMQSKIEIQNKSRLKSPCGNLDQYR